MADAPNWPKYPRETALACDRTLTTPLKFGGMHPEQGDTGIDRLGHFTGLTAARHWNNQTQICDPEPA
jgi:hypothetical protein